MKKTSIIVLSVLISFMFGFKAYYINSDIFDEIFSNAVYSEMSNSNQPKYLTYSCERYFDITDECENNLCESAKELFNQAYFVQLVFFNDVAPNLQMNEPIDENNIIYATPYSYDSFYEYVNEIYTDEYTKKLFNEYNCPYVNIDGYLCFAQAGRGFHNVDSVVLSEKEHSNQNIVIEAIVSYLEYDGEINIRYTQKFTYEIINTPNGWRFDNFELWK